MRLRELSIKKKFILVLIIFMFVPTLVLSGWMYRKVSESWIQNEYRSQSNELGGILRTTELQLKKYEELAYSLYGYDHIIEMMKKDTNKRIPLDYVKTTNSLRSILNEENYINSVYLFSDKGEVFFQDAQTSGSYEKLYRENPNWENKIKEANGKLIWLPTFSIQKNKKELQLFSCGMVVKNLTSSVWEPQGVFVINISPELFDTLFRLLGQEDEGKTYLITDDEGIVIWSNKLTLGDSLDKIFFQSIMDSQEADSEQDYEEERYVVTKFQSEYNGWNYISMRKKSEVLKTGRWVFTSIVVQIVFILFFSIAGAVILQRNIVQPIQKMVVAMNVPEKELVGVRLSIDQEDEIGKLYQSFNEMNAKIENFIEKNKEMNVREKEYQIQALNAQINPHFIYNTLDTLHWMALDIPSPEMSNLITSFSDLLRYSISKKESVVTLEEEIQCIRNYIHIYEERYEMTFGSFQIDERVYPYKTFKMLLQPIVENCIIHGFSQNMDDAVVEVIGRMDGEEAVLYIRDNGVGISEERITYILSKDSDRVGLSNINQRLKLLYGDDYGLKILSEKGRGTEVILRFPKESVML